MSERIEKDVLKMYNERLIHKLEEKTLDLEKSNKALAERIKELNCLYSISEFIEKAGFSLDEIMPKLVLSPIGPGSIPW